MEKKNKQTNKPIERFMPLTSLAVYCAVNHPDTRIWQANYLEECPVLKKKLKIADDSRCRTPRIIQVESFESNALGKKHKQKVYIVFPSRKIHLNSSIIEALEWKFRSDAHKWSSVKLSLPKLYPYVY